jgi:bifunctional DNA primase/polymerase-like protein
VNGGFDHFAELRCAAMAMVSYGWPVLRGTYLDDAGCWRGRAGLVDLRPIDDDWQTAWTRKATQVAAWWAEEPYSLLIACGNGVDGVELPVQAGPKVLRALDASDVRPPAMLTPVGSLVLFVRTAPEPRPFLVSASLRSAGSWVPMPPTGQSGAPRSAQYRWVLGASPCEVRWELPDLTSVYEIVSAAVRHPANTR